MVVGSCPVGAAIAGALPASPSVWRGPREDPPDLVPARAGRGHRPARHPQGGPAGRRGADGRGHGGVRGGGPGRLREDGDHRGRRGRGARQARGGAGRRCERAERAGRMSAVAALRVLHDIPGRLRLGLPASADPREVVRTLEGQRGFLSWRWNQRTRSLLLLYDAQASSSETLLGTAMSRLGDAEVERAPAAATRPAGPPTLAMAVSTGMAE